MITIISVLMTLLSPSLKNIQEKAMTLTCKNNLKNVSIATGLIISDNDALPQGVNDNGRLWYKKGSPIPNYLGHEKTKNKDFYQWNADTSLNCPSSPFQDNNGTNFYCDYGGNKDILNSRRMKAYPIAEIKSPSHKVLFMDFHKLGNPSTNGGYWGLASGWEYRKTNINHNYIWTGRHQGDFNILWIDLHVSSRLMGDLEDVNNFRPNYKYTP